MEPEEYELIEKYKNDELSPSEKESFEARMANDQEFGEVVNSYLEIDSSLQAGVDRKKQEDELRHTLNTLSDQYFEHEKSARIISMRNVYWVAAACAILLVSLIYMIYSPSQPTYQEYANYQTLALADRGNNNELSLQAEEAFNNGEYNEASTLLEDLVNSESEDNHNLELYWALSLIEIDNYVKADSLLSNIERKKSVYGDMARWYLALSYLKQERIEDCKQQLRKIPEDSAHYNEAQKLLKEL